MKTERRAQEFALSLVAFTGLGLFSWHRLHAMALPIQDSVSGPPTVLPGSDVTYYAAGDPPHGAKFIWNCTGGMIASTHNKHASAAIWRAPRRPGIYQITVRQPEAIAGSCMVAVR